MDAKAFAEACREERDSLLTAYLAPDSETEVARMLRDASLSADQAKFVSAALAGSVTDAFYTILLALDGAVSLGGKQTEYRLATGDGAIITDGEGDLEAAAWEAFHGGN